MPFSPVTFTYILSIHHTDAYLGYWSIYWLGENVVHLRFWVIKWGKPVYTQMKLKALHTTADASSERNTGVYSTLINIIEYKTQINYIGLPICNDYALVLYSKLPYVVSSVISSSEFWLYCHSNKTCSESNYFIIRPENSRLHKIYFGQRWGRDTLFYILKLF